MNLRFLCEGWKYIPCPKWSTTPITAMGRQQCLPLSVVQLKGKHCRKPHCRNGVVDTFRQCQLPNFKRTFFNPPLFQFRSVCMHFWPKHCGFVASSPQILEYFLGTITCLLAKRKEDTRWGEIFFTFFFIHSNYRDCAVDHIRSSPDHHPFIIPPEPEKLSLGMGTPLGW